LASGEPVLGGYGVVTHASYGFGRAARFVLYHAGSLVILTGVIPVCALVLLLIAGVGQGERDRGVRAFLAVTGSLAVWMVVEVGVFASRYVGRLAERDLIGLAPLLFLGFVVWLRRGGQRGYWPMSVAGVLVAVPLVFLPLRSLVTSYAPPDAPSLIALLDLRTSTSLTTMQLVFYVVAAAAILAFALLPRRLLVLLPLALVAGLAASSIAASRYVADQSRQRATQFLGPDARWVDQAAPAPVAYLDQPGVEWPGVWETVFWNTHINRVYDLGNTSVFGPMPQQRLTVKAGGRLLGADRQPIDPRYLVTATGAVASEPTLAFDGQPIADNAQPGNQQAMLTLWRLTPPARLLYRIAGLKPNGDIYPGGDGRILAYGCSHRDYLLTLLIKQPETVTILRNGRVYTRLSFRAPSPDQPWRTAIPATPPPSKHAAPGTCTLDVRPSGLTGTTVFQTNT
jgi:hypothetical protein